jgi:membrane-associated phospholipid phosphatase
VLEGSLPSRIRHGFHIYGEYAYIFVYPMVPSAIAVLYFLDAMDQVNEFWSVVLPPAYLSYATLPFVRTMPPRSLEKPREPQVQRAGIRRFNLFVIGQVTHQANTFPSGHAAAAVAVALELARVAPPAVGVIYGIVALSIMAGAFFGRYHYAADVLLGAALAVINFLLVVQR